MYYCMKCKGTFYEPAQCEEDHGWDTEYGHMAAYETFEECPYCGYGDFELAEECCMCGGWFPKSEMEIGDGFTYICQQCYEEMEDEQE